MKWVKWSGIALGGLLGVLLVAGLLGVWWLVSSIRGYMVPTEPQPDDISIVERSPAGPEPADGQAVRTPVSPAAANWADLAHPPSGARPWVRWWWPGAAVDAAQACTQLEALEAAGFGAVEIQPFSAGLHVIESDAVHEQVNRVGEADYHDTLTAVIACADAMGVDVWLNHLSGWPAGGPQVTIDDGLHELAYAEISVRGGRRIVRDLPVPQPGFNDYLMAFGESQFGFDLTNFARGHETLVSVVAARQTGGERSGNPLDATDTVILDPQSTIVLTDHVENGELVWEAPEGEWRIVASYVMPAGEAPTLSAYGRSGYVIDHLRTDRIRSHYNYAFGEETGLAPFYGEAFQGFFNDSLEFKVSRLSTQDILDAFERRRGYDLEPWLPAVYRDSVDNYFIREVGRLLPEPAFRLSDQDARIRHDYQLTLSDLVIDRFVEGSAQWAGRHGLLSRGQSYGLDIDVIRALGANDIPETEQLFSGGSPYFLKMAGAAAALYDRPRVSAEAFVWAKRAYAITPRQVRAAADALFLSGINAAIYHGIAYSPDTPEFQETYGELGWYPFFGPDNPSGFSNDYGPTSTLWPALPELNAYLARTQSLLQTGRPDVDVWIYYPFLGFPTALEDSPAARDGFLFMGAMPGESLPDPAGRYDIPFVTLPEDQDDPRVAWLEALMPVAEALDEAGVTWSWVNDHALQSGAFEANGGGQVLLANLPALPLATLDALEGLDARGTAIALVGDAPDQVPGFDPSGAEDAELQARLEVFAPPRTLDPADAVAWTRPAVENRLPGPIRRVSRETETGHIHYLVNQDPGRTEADLALRDVPPGEPLTWFDPVSGAVWPAEAGADGRVNLSLAGLESRFLIVGPTVPSAGSVPASVRARDLDAASLPASAWTLQVGDARRALGEAFIDWRDDPDLVHADDPVTYSATIELDAASARRARILDLGRVEGQALVRINGGPERRIALDPFLLDLPDGLEPGETRIDITIVPPRRNALLGQGQSGEARYEFLSALEGGPTPAGLLGPVRLLSVSAQSDDAENAGTESEDPE